MSESFLSSAIVYLAAAVIFVPLAIRLKLGSVLGYLIAGCLIGPFGFGLVSDVGAILHFAELGVVLMLFLLGLELDATRLWSMRSQTFGGGSLQMAACGAVLSAAAMLAGLPWRAGMIAGFALALSSTAIAMQTLKERGLIESDLGRSAFGILLFQDLAAIPLISVVPLLAIDAAPSEGSPWLAIGKVVAAVIVVILLGRYAIGPTLRAMAHTELREIFTAFALLLVIGIAELMSLAGVSMALGAFLAGILLASSEYRHALEADIEPFRGLLMGLFFMAVGMSIDFGLLSREPLEIAALVLGFVLLKTTTLGLLAGGLGIAARQRWPFAALLSQGGEFAFVVFGLAAAARVMPGEWDAMLTLAVALSMGLTPLLLLLADVWQRRQPQPQREVDRVDAEEAPILIAGFGRFGQIVGRLLFASGLRATVLDFDSDNIDVLRRFGFRVFYGDATRLDLLHAAGAGHARAIVNAIDDIGSNLKLVEIVQTHFPQLPIITRARNVTHWNELRRRNVTIIERETFESALLAGRHTLEALGVHPFEARERADQFRRHNLASLESLRVEAEDDEKRVTLARASRAELEQQFQRDREQLERELGSGWRGTSSRGRGS